MTHDEWMAWCRLADASLALQRERDRRPPPPADDPLLLGLQAEYASALAQKDAAKDRQPTGETP